MGSSKRLPTVKSASEILDLYYLDMRSALLETASGLDRISRADGDVSNDPRLRKLRLALEILSDADGNKAVRFLEAFSV